MTALSRAVSSVLTSNADKEQRLPGSSASGFFSPCAPRLENGRAVWVSPFGAFCALSSGAFTPFLDLKINCIIFGDFLRCTLHLENGWYCGMGKSLRRVLCAFGRGICSFLDLKTNCIFFVRCIVFLVQMAYNNSASRKGMISWLELQQTSASEWTAT